MQKENKKQKKQMRGGFTLPELMFTILILIGLAFIAHNVLNDSPESAAIASQVSDLKNAEKQVSDYIASSNSINYN